MTERVTINDRGVIVIPIQLRETLGLKPDDELILETVEQGLLLRPSGSRPSGSASVEIYSEARIAEFGADEKALGQLLPPKS